MKNFFNPRNVAVIGVSRDQNKIGHVIFRNLIDSDFKGKVYAVNNNAKEILGMRIYKNVSSIKGKIDLAIIATPAETIMNVVKDCNKKGIKNLVIITAGFKEWVLPVTQILGLSDSHILANTFKFNSKGDVIGLHSNEIARRKKSMIV